MIDIEKLADEFFEFPDENNKQYVTFFSAKLFAEAYHKAMCEQSEIVAELQTAISWIKYITGLNNLDNLPSGTKLYTTPQPLKRLSDKAIGDCLNKAELPTIMLNPIVVEKLDNFANAIMDEMERINK